LAIPLVPRPTSVGNFELTHNQPVFGPVDNVPLGRCFHGIAKEWGETPAHFSAYGCTPCNDPTQAAESWADKKKYFGTFTSSDDETSQIENWGGYPIKCFRVPIQEVTKHLPIFSPAHPPTRFYTYAGLVPGPTFKVRIGQPHVVRFENHLEAEMSVHLHGGHSPSHSDGFPSFYVLQGKSRDYFYPNIVPLIKKNGNWTPDVGECQSTMWYHDHSMDATAYNVNKGLAGFALCFGEEELRLIRDRVLPGYGHHSCIDPERDQLQSTPENPDPNQLEDPDFPGFYRKEMGKEPYYNPFDIPLVLQDKVLDPNTAQIAYDRASHNGYLGDTFFVNGVPVPHFESRNRKYRLRLLNGCNARVMRLRLVSLEDFQRLHSLGIRPGNEDPNGTIIGNDYDAFALPFLRIGKDSWLWSKAKARTSIVLAMANRADLIVDFGALAAGIHPGEQKEYVLINTMPQTDGRGPRQKLDDAGDPRVQPLPFDLVNAVDADGNPLPVVQGAELNRPISLMKFIVRHAPPGSLPEDPEGDEEASVTDGSDLIATHESIADDEVKVVREFIFERSKGAWQINGRFYDPTIANAAPVMDSAEEWVLRNGGGGWWHPIHIHLESHQLIAIEKDFGADEIIDLADPPARNRLNNLVNVTPGLDETELQGRHDTQVLGPNSVARIRIRTRTWMGPFVFHCHNIEHEDMRMMFNFEPVAHRIEADGSLTQHDPNVVPDRRTHGQDVTLYNAAGELNWEYRAVPQAPVGSGNEGVVPPRRNP
jgi:FtsP/CotA-like multicopper oxidase with cupredoxin domain